MAGLKLQAVTKSWDGKTQVIKPLTLDVADGEFIVMVGPSGCGKSTLLRMVAGLEREISRTEADLNKLVDALIEAPKSAHARIYTKMEALEAQKEDLETNLAKLRVAQRIRYTEAEVLVWMKKFCDGDPMVSDSRVTAVLLNGQKVI